MKLKCWAFLVRSTSVKGTGYQILSDHGHSAYLTQHNTTLYKYLCLIEVVAQLKEFLCVYLFHFVQMQNLQVTLIGIICLKRVFKSMFWYRISKDIEQVPLHLLWIYLRSETMKSMAAKSHRNSYIFVYIYTAIETTSSKSCYMKKMEHRNAQLYDVTMNTILLGHWKLSTLRIFIWISFFMEVYIFFVQVSSL